MDKERDLELIRLVEWVLYYSEKMGGGEQSLKSMRSRQQKWIERYRKQYGVEPDLTGAIESRLPGGKEPDWEQVKESRRCRQIRMRVVGALEVKDGSYLVAVEVVEGEAHAFRGAVTCGECPGEWRIMSVGLVDPPRRDRNREVLSLEGPRTLREGMELSGRDESA
jgi:hypothetical protein